ncbi:hypothetical protein [Bifidobacterium leontopitheci]|uniref:Uncharacterized protein n=1 Tax=Bifidobacterium leontopitheci TaxID=2650774 RepID=A0A6I1GFR3_9BIFI|nr:hypothetical protein [Bifidobacterium leontopitheci]KAB7790480.1 hypothetical protein F7D09_0976 [Bifidobacterium leontopitheci]
MNFLEKLGEIVLYAFGVIATLVILVLAAFFSSSLGEAFTNTFNWTTSELPALVGSILVFGLFASIPFALQAAIVNGILKIDDRGVRIVVGLIFYMPVAAFAMYAVQDYPDWSNWWLIPTFLLFYGLPMLITVVGSSEDEDADYTPPELEDVQEFEDEDADMRRPVTELGGDNPFANEGRPTVATYADSGSVTSNRNYTVTAQR